MTTAYLVHWQENIQYGHHYWDIPGALGKIDMRTIPQMSVSGGVSQGYAIATYPGPIVDAGAVYLGDDPKGPMPLARRRSMAQELGFDPRDLDSVFSLSEGLRKVVTEMADPTGASAVRPFIPTVQGVLELHLPGYSWAEPFNLGVHSATARVLETTQVEYRKVQAWAWETQTALSAAGLTWDQVLYQWQRLKRGDSVDVGFEEATIRRLIRLMPPDHHQKMLGGLIRKYRTKDYRQFIPADLPDEGWLKPDTTITESFNTADSDTLGPDLSWTELAGDWDIVTNAAQIAGSAANARADSALSSGNHYAQVKLLNINITSTDRGVMARKDNTGTLTWYQATSLEGTSFDSWRTFKVVANSYTGIGTDDFPDTVADDIIKIAPDGTSIKRYRNGSLEDTATDSAIGEANHYCGLASFGSAALRVDEFEAKDLAVAAGVEIFRRRIEGY